MSIFRSIPPFNPATFKHTIGDYNIITDTDSYKNSHWSQYPPNTTKIFEYIESRGGQFNTTVFFGLQYYIKEFLSRPFTQYDIWEAKDMCDEHIAPGVFNIQMWDYILKEHGGYLPIEISAVPEGFCIPTSNLLCSITNTDDKCFPLPSHVETGILRSIWYGTSVATLSFEIKKIIMKYMIETASSDSMESIDFRLHDFGARGVSSYESAGLGGMAHLVNFQGTDNQTALLQAKKYYHESMAGYSVPAMEHSSVTSWGKEGEDDAYLNMIDTFGGKGNIVSIVSDSYDIHNAVKNIFGNKLYLKITESGTRLVVRPDSGVPKDMVLEIVRALGESFGFIVNDKGYKVLPGCVRVLQGDGINIRSIQDILLNLTFNGWSAENVFFGMGGALLSGPNRDTQRFACKASAAIVNGIWTDVYKDPITDSGKRSKKGVIGLYRNRLTGEYTTERTISSTHAIETELWDRVDRPVFRNGKLLEDDTLETARGWANMGYPLTVK